MTEICLIEIAIKYDYKYDEKNHIKYLQELKI